MAIPSLALPMNNNSVVHDDADVDDQIQDSSNHAPPSMIDRLEFPHAQQQSDEKLPLKNAWGTFFYKADKQRDWKQNVIYITSINYVEDFWSFYTHTYGLRDLSNGCDYMLFKVTDRLLLTNQSSLSLSLLLRVDRLPSHVSDFSCRARAAR